MVELPYADRCCGSAGIYNIMEPEMSGKILSEKMRHIASTGASVVATGNPGCLLQIWSGARSEKLPITLAHPVQLLDWAYSATISGARPQSQ
jgi:glycolate oxidase iron-sulfur subunit